MIKSITITNHLAESITLELERPEDSGFLVLAVEGLGPGKANINVVANATGDGSLYNSARVNARNILIRLRFLENPTIEATRQLSYKYFPIKKRIKLTIETDNRECYIYGNVESNEPNIFSNEEGTQISLVCPDPYFYSLENHTTIFSSAESLFEFEFSNESLAEDLINFGEITRDVVQNILYSGDAEVGVVITIHVFGPVSNITIYNLNTRESMKIDTDRLVVMTGVGLSTGDDVIISTVKGDKYVFLLREGQYINILNCLDKKYGLVSTIQRRKRFLLIQRILAWTTLGST